MRPSTDDVLAVEAIKERLQTNPYGLIAGAFGVGFVLGGGLFTRLTARLVKLALRASLMAALPVIQGGLLGAGDRAPRP